jgi:hypothetical protein
MDPSPWSRQAPPSESSVAASLGSWPLQAWADLTASRRQLRVRAGDGVGPVGASEDDVERLLLAYEELTSNGFRHGRPPVQAVVSAGPAGWLIDVVDSDPAQPPVPAVDRDPSLGGLGLSMVARLAAAHGWFPRADRKHVWAWITPASAG